MRKYVLCLGLTSLWLGAGTATAFYFMLQGYKISEPNTAIAAAEFIISSALVVLGLVSFFQLFRRY